MDAILSGGWQLGGISNIIGDSSTGKSFLALKACKEFLKRFPDARIRYAETTGSFDDGIAYSLDIPFDNIEVVNHDELLLGSFAKDFVSFSQEDSVPGIYVLDTFDGLILESELDREFGATSNNHHRFIQMRWLGRILANCVRNTNKHLMILSHIQDDYRFSLSKKYYRVAGDSLDIYCNQIVWLAYKNQLFEFTNNGASVCGVNIKARCTKMPEIPITNHECEFAIMHAEFTKP